MNRLSTPQKKDSKGHMVYGVQRSDILANKIGTESFENRVFGLGAGAPGTLTPQMNPRRVSSGYQFNPNSSDNSYYHEDIFNRPQESYLMTRIIIKIY